MKIYTKTGDKGETGLFGGDRVSKTDIRIEAIGTVDELNAAIGLCRACGAGTFDGLLELIQSWLFDAGGELATPSQNKHFKPTVGQAEIKSLEDSIDRFTSNLEPLRNFILPGGSQTASYLHLARTICRRAERRILELASKDTIRTELVVFFNRLSDWLFTAARMANHESGVADVEWRSTETDKK